MAIVLGGAVEYAEGLIADLVAVTVRAVEQVAAPPLTYSGEVRHLVAQPGRDQDATSAHRAAVLEDDVEPSRACAPVLAHWVMLVTVPDMSSPP